MAFGSPCETAPGALLNYEGFEKGQGSPNSADEIDLKSIFLLHTIVHLHL